MNAIELRASISLAIVYVMRMLGLFMVVPVIAIASVSYPDYSALWVGIAIGGYGLTQALLQIPMGMASDKFGRKPVIYIGLILFILGSLIAANADSMVQLTIGRIMQGMGAIAGAVMALAADVTRDSQRTKIMAIIGISIGFSFYLALLIGPMVTAAFGLTGIFYLTAIGATLCIPIIKYGVVNKHEKPSADAIARSADIKLLFKDSQLARLNVSVFAIHLLITSFFIQIPILLTRLDFELNDHWKIYAPILICSVFVLAILMKLRHRFSQVVTLIIAILLLFLSFTIFLLGESKLIGLSWIWVLTAGVLFFGGFNFLEASFPSMVSSIAPAGKKGSAMGIYASFQFLGAFFGGLISGLLATLFAVTSVYVFCLAFLIVLALIVIGLKEHLKVKNLTIVIPSNVDLSTLTKVEQLEQKIRSVRGVKDARVEPSSKALYIKSASSSFDIENVHETLNNH